MHKKAIRFIIELHRMRSARNKYHTPKRLTGAPGQGSGCSAAVPRSRAPLEGLARPSASDPACLWAPSPPRLYVLGAAVAATLSLSEWRGNIFLV